MVPSGLKFNEATNPIYQVSNTFNHKDIHILGTCLESKGQHMCNVAKLILLRKPLMSHFLAPEHLKL